MRGVDAQRLHTGQPRETHECSAIRDRPVAKHPRQQSERVIGQRRIDERFLSVDGFRRTTAWQATSV